MPLVDVGRKGRGPKGVAKVDVKFQVHQMEKAWRKEERGVNRDGQPYSLDVNLSFAYGNIIGGSSAKE